jgi:hypothetical protein
MQWKYRVEPLAQPKPQNRSPLIVGLLVGGLALGGAGAGAAFFYSFSTSSETLGGELDVVRAEFETHGIAARGYRTKCYSFVSGAARCAGFEWRSQRFYVAELATREAAVVSLRALQQQASPGRNAQRGRLVLYVPDGVTAADATKLVAAFERHPDQ